MNYSNQIKSNIVILNKKKWNKSSDVITIINWYITFKMEIDDIIETLYKQKYHIANKRWLAKSREC